MNLELVEQFKNRELKIYPEEIFEYYKAADLFVLPTREDIWGLVINEAMNYVGGILLYANTDGFLIQNPVNLLITSKNLGDMKLEASGDAYIVRTDNYILYQTYKADTGEKELKGSCMKCVRDKIDLSTGKIIVYDKVLHVIGKNANGKNCGYFENKNEREIKLDIKEIA